MEFKDFSVQPCKSRLAFEFIPNKPLQLDLQKVSSSLAKQGISIEINTPFLLVVKHQGTEFSISKKGKVIVKHVQDAELAKQKALTIVKNIPA
jgi:hypothetical protein